MRDARTESPSLTSPVRLAVAVIVSRFPKTTETFILRELVEMERRGQPVRLVPLLEEKDEVVHTETAEWVERALYTPFLSAAILAANWRAFRRAPRHYLSTALRALAGSAGSLNLLLGTLGILPKSVYLGERLAAEGIAQVHAHFATHPAMAAWIIWRLSGIPYSFTVHAHDIFLHSAFLGEKIDGARFVRSISEFNRRFLEERFPESAPGKVETVYLGVDVRLFSPARSVRECDDPGREAAPAAIVCVAALRPYKGLPVLIAACALLRDAGVPFTCELIGDGPQRQEIAGLVADHGLEHHVRLLGALPEAAVAEHLGTATLFVLPSIVAPNGQMDGIPVVLMEAMAAGLPVVSTALSGIPELVEDGVNGLVVEPGNTEELAAAMQRLIGDPGLVVSLARRARETVETRFSLRSSVESLLERLDRFAPVAPAEVPPILAASDLAFSALGIRRIHEGRRSRVFRLLTANGHRTRELVLKVHPSRPDMPRSAAARARLEFEILERLEQDFTGRALDSVPRPLYLDEDAAAVLMEACEGAPLDSLLRRHRWSAWRDGFCELVLAVEKSGEWLRCFQHGTRKSSDVRTAWEDMLSGAERNLASCTNRWFSSRFGQSVWKRLELQASRIDMGNGSLCGVHHDFWPGNIFVSRQGVQVIDFEGYAEGHPFLDSAYFLVQAELFLAYPVLSARFRRLEHAFLRGWLGKDSPDAPALALARTAMALHVLAGTPGERRTGGARLWRRVVRLRSIIVRS